MENQTSKLSMIDLFCGAGGVTYGVQCSDVVDVQVAINHDEAAIMAHRANHPNTVHLMEDIQDVERIFPHLPDQIDLLWASAECTNFSIAKGGSSRDADSRSLPSFLPAYVDKCKPTFFFVENVKEFKLWGPLRVKEDKKNSTKTYSALKYKYNRKAGEELPVMIPVKEKMGIYFEDWIKKIEARGYVYKEALLNAADFGAPTKRIRYFACFHKPEANFEWPEPTHSQHPEKTGLEPWLSCRDFIDLDDHGTSVFGRSKNLEIKANNRNNLSDKTLDRIAYGFEKFFLKPLMQEQQYFVKYYNTKHNVSGINEPLHTITVKDRMGLINLKGKINYLSQNIQRSMNASSIDEPIGTILTRDEKVICSAFISNKQSNKYNVASLDEPMKSIVTKEWSALISVIQFINKKYSGKHQVQSIDEPLHTITANTQNALVSLESNKQEAAGLFGHDEAFEAFIAQKNSDKRDFFQHYFPEIWEELDILISDITMRYLTGRELARITGFPEDYFLGKSETAIKKHIGNAVPKVIPEAIATRVFELNQEQLRKTA